MVIYNHVFWIKQRQITFTRFVDAIGVIIIKGNFVNIRQFKTIDVFKMWIAFAGPCQHMRRKLVAVYSINRTIATVKQVDGSFNVFVGDCKKSIPIKARVGDIVSRIQYTRIPICIICTRYHIGCSGKLYIIAGGNTS